MMLLREELREPAAYYSILLAIAGGNATPKLIAEHAGVDADSIGAYLKTLVGLQLIERKVPFGDDPSKSRKGMYVVSDPFFAYWFRFVGRNMSILEGNVGETVARRLAFGPAFDAYVGQQFETVCQQWLIRRNAAGELPFIATQFGKWWGNDPIAREQTDIDVIAADPLAKTILLGECKWRNSFNESEAIERLRRRTDLVKGYSADDAWMTLFTKRSVAKSTSDRYAGDERMSFVTAEDLYEQ